MSKEVGLIKDSAGETNTVIKTGDWQGNRIWKEWNSGIFQVMQVKFTSSLN